MKEKVKMLRFCFFFIPRAAPKVMPPILLCWPTTSEVDVGGMTAEAAPSR